MLCHVTLCSCPLSKLFPIPFPGEPPSSLALVHFQSVLLIAFTCSLRFAPRDPSFLPSEKKKSKKTFRCRIFQKTEDSNCYFTSVHINLSFLLDLFCSGEIIPDFEIVVIGHEMKDELTRRKNNNNIPKGCRRRYK